MYIGAIELEERNPGLDDVGKIARAIDVSIRELLDERMLDLRINLGRVEENRSMYSILGRTYVDLFTRSRTGFSKAA